MVLFGSYSMLATIAGTPSFLRLKSITRYIRLGPPPLPRVVILPLLLRPPVFLNGSRRLFSGRLVVILSKFGVTAFLIPGVIGFKCFKGILESLVYFYAVTSFECYYCFFSVRHFFYLDSETLPFSWSFGNVYF